MVHSERRWHWPTLGTLLGLGVVLSGAGVAAPAPVPAPASAPAPETAPAPAPPAQAFVVQRGTNASHWLSQSQRRGEERRHALTHEDVALVARLGFDHLRLPVDEEQLFDEAGRPDEEAFGLLNAALDWCAEAHLRAIVDLHILRSHHFNEGERPLWTRPAAQERFLALWRELSRRLSARPLDAVAYELLNEPVAADPEDWNRLVARAIATVREHEPERTLVVGSNMWQSPDTFDRLRLPEGDRHILLSFHFYTPMALTHYHARWTKAGEYTGPLQYPGDVVGDADILGLAADLVAALGGRERFFDRSVLEELIAKPLARAKATGLPLYCGEWGALPSAPRPDRLRWYADFRNVLEKNGVAWATWDLKGSFGLLSREGQLDDELVATLVPRLATPRAERDEAPHGSVASPGARNLGDATLVGPAPPVAPLRSRGLGILEAEGEVGEVRHPGAVVFDRGRNEYRLTGAGTNMWGTTDAFHYAWRRMAGDLDLATVVRFVGAGVNAHRKAGLVVRASLAADAPYADAIVHGDGLLSLQYRETAGGETREVRARLSAVPAAIRLARRGDVFTFYAARPGAPLEELGSLRLALGDVVHAGLAVCSHEAEVLETAVFSEVTMSSTKPVVAEPREPNVESRLEIYTLATGHRRTVYTARGRFEAPNWSRDGASLIINREGRLYRVPVGGGGEPVVIDTDFATRCNNDHGLSPDGAKLAISHHADDGRSLIYVLPSRGGTPRLVTANGPSYWHGWSPDGRRHAYCAERGGNFDVYTIADGGGSETRLTDAAGLDDGPEYTADGRYIYFNSERTGLMQIWRMRPDGSEQTQITNDGRGDWFAHPSPDGKWIVFLSYDASVKGHPPDKDVTLRLLPQEGGTPRVLVELFGGQGTINVPSWSSDSAELAFVSYRRLD